MAPATAASRMCGVTMAGSITPLPMVFATCVPSTAKATKLKNAAQTTATRGDSTRVETTVAIELAASWKPLMKSNASARPMMIQTSSASDMDQLFLITMDSIVFATSSHWSAAFSRRP